MSTKDLDDFELPKRRPDGLVIGLSIAFVLLLGGAFWLLSVISNARAEVVTAKARILELEAEVQEKEEDIASLREVHQQHIAQLDQDWNERMEEQKAREEELRANSLEAIGQIINESGNTLEYLTQLENKVRDGKALQQEEINQLQAIGNGLAYLHTQYQKPITQFAELDDFLAQMMQVQTAQPVEQKKFLRSVFSRRYREEYNESIAAYHEDQGRREAATQAREQLGIAYKRAQADMEALSLSHERYMASLNELVATKETNIEGLDSFFDVSQEILQIHKRVMDVTIDEPRAASAPANP